MSNDEVEFFQIARGPIFQQRVVVLSRIVFLAQTVHDLVAQFRLLLQRHRDQLLPDTALLDLLRTRLKNSMQQSIIRLAFALKKRVYFEKSSTTDPSDGLQFSSLLCLFEVLFAEISPQRRVELGHHRSSVLAKYYPLSGFAMISQITAAALMVLPCAAHWTRCTSVQASRP